MATTSTVPAVFDYLQEQLARRPGLSQVQVTSAPLPIGQVKPLAIQLDGTDEHEIEPGTLGNLRRRERYDVLGSIYLQQPGADEVTFRRARDRAYDLLGEIEAFLIEDHKLGGRVISASMTSAPMDQGVAPNGDRVARLTFAIHIEATLTRT